VKASDIYLILRDIGENSSRSYKEDTVARYAYDPLFQKALRYAYDPFVTFGLTPPRVESEGAFDFDETSRSVWALLDGLSKRLITGGEAMESVKELLRMCSPGANELLWRILSKDLRCGISTSTINKVAPNTIPSFDVMLAHPFEEKRVKSWPAIAEPKLDGVRVICLVKDGAAQFFSRSGKLFPSVDHLGPKIARMVADATLAAAPLPPNLASLYSRLLGSGTHSIALDGEIITGGFNKTVGDVRRKSASAADAEYHIFDAVPFDVMTGSDNCFALSYQERREFVHWMVSKQSDPAIRRLPSYLVNSVSEAQEFYTRFRNDGLEGAIIKPLGGFYEKKRSYGWLKIKAEETEDLTITGAFEGTGKYVGKLGGLIVDRLGVEVRVGAGFSDAEREELWQNYVSDMVPGHTQTLIGRLIEVEYHEVTPDGSLRHPRFVRFRDDKTEVSVIKRSAA
jgi:ATP-dependent DNA ligase